MYLPLHKLKIPSSNVRRSGIALIVSGACFAAFLIAHAFDADAIEYYALQFGLLSLVFTIVFAAPYIAGAIAVFLAPPALFVALDSPSLSMVRQWWFWLFVIAAVAVGIRILAAAEKKYPKRDL
jgi:hypothetical protein